MGEARERAYPKRCSERASPISHIHGDATQRLHWFLFPDLSMPTVVYGCLRGHGQALEPVFVHAFMIAVRRLMGGCLYVDDEIWVSTE